MDLEVTRQNLIKLGNQLRKKHGPGILAHRIAEKLKRDQDYTIDSIRNPEEVKTLQKGTNFLLLNIDAPAKTRFDRMKKRNIEHDPQTYEDFVKLEQAEASSSDETKQQIILCQKMADKILINDSSMLELHQKINSILPEDKKKYLRPSWDEYFINIVKEVAKRATCDRGRTATVIVKDKRILTTGYVGSPIGLPHCDDVGHLMKKVQHEDGSESMHCLRTVHSELNAIAQAARHGIRIDGATPYCLMEPCDVCAKMIINSGIKRVVAQNGYHATKASRQMFNEAGVQLDVMNDEIRKYDNQQAT